MGDAAARTTTTGEGAALMPSTVRAFMREYGQLAFGVASLMLIWFVIVGPELARNRVDTRQLAEISQSQVKLGMVLERLVDRIERVADKLERRSEPER
jgi:hypothetical protein